MKPVELEIIMRDSTRQGMQSVEGNVEALNQQIEQQNALINKLEADLNSMQAVFEKASHSGDQTENIAMIAALRKEVANLKGALAELEKQQGKTSSAPVVPPAAPMGLKEQIAEVKANIKYMEDYVKQYEKSMKGMAPGKEQAAMKQELEGAKAALLAEKQALAQLEQQLGKTGEKQTTLRTQIAQLKQEMSMMTEGTDEYRMAMERLGQLQDQYGDISTQGRIFSDDNKNIKATMDAVSGLSGAMTAGVGVASLFGMEEEKLAQIQTKLQAVMAITMGVQQVANTLNKDSYFTHIILGKAKKALTVATELETASKSKSIIVTKLATAAQWALNVAVSANPYVLLVAALIAVVAALGALTYAYFKFCTGANEAEREQRRLTLEIERTRSAIKQISDDVDFDVRIAEAAGSSKGELIALRKEAAKTALALADLNYDQIDKKYFEGKATQEQREEAKKIAQEAWNNYNKVMQDAIVNDYEERTKKKEKKDGGKTDKANDLAAAELRARQKIDETMIAIMAEGAEKKRAQAALDFEREKERIKKEESERLAIYESLKKAGVKVDENQPQIIRRQAGSQRVLAGVVYDEKINKINEDENKGKLESFENLLKPYRDFAKQRLDIEKQYNDDIAKLKKEKENAEGDAGKEKLISDAIVVAEEEKANALADLDKVFAEKDVNFQVFMNRLGEMSLEQLQAALAKAEKALNDSTLKNGKDSAKTAVASAKVKALKDEIAYVKAENESKAPDDLTKWKKTSDSVKKCKGQIDAMISSMDGLDESTKAALQAASNVADGAIGMIDGIKTLSVAAGESISAVEKASVILAIVGAAIQIMTAIFNMGGQAEKRHQEALAEVAANKLAMQREYNLLLLQQNLLMKEATTIFGDKEIAKAANAVKVYRDAIEQYKETLIGTAPKIKFSLDVKGSIDTYKRQKEAYEKGIGALNDVTVKTGHKKTGLFGWGKGKDIYSGVLDVYPDLIDAENKLNLERAKTIINTQTMSDESKALLQNLIDLQEQADEAQESLRDYLQDTFGGLGDGILDSITEAIRSGNDAWDSFGDKGAEVLESLGRQIMYSLFFADKFAKLQKDLEKIYGSDKSEEEIARDAMNLVGDFYDNIGKDMDAAEEFAKNWQEEAAKRGFDLWRPEDSASQSGRAGEFTTISQEQGTKLEGLFTAVQMHVSKIDDTVESIYLAMYEAFDVLLQIAENTAYCKHLEQMADDIASLKRDGFKMK